MTYKTNEIQRKEVRGVRINLSAEARVTNTSIKTIKKRLSGELKEKSVQLRTSKLDEYKDLIIEKIDKLQVTAKAVYEFIKTKGYNGSYETVKIFIRKHRKKVYKETFIRVLRTPGLQAQVDWKESKTFISKSGVPYEVNIFAYILCYSQYRFYKLTTNRKQDTLFKCLVEAFKATSGVPNEIWFDNMKTVVPEKGIYDDGGFDDDFEIYDMDVRHGPDESLKDYRVVIECSLNPGRAEKILEYIREQLEHTDEIELWSIWLGDYDQKISWYEAKINEFTAEDLMEIADLPVKQQPLKHHCVRIRK